MTAPVTIGDAQAVRLGIAIPRLDQPGAGNLDRTLARCIRLGISVVDISMDAIEAALGAPAPTVPLEPPPADGVSFGLLELEEDVLRDSYDLAKQTFDAQLRTWRQSTSLAPLAALARSWQAGGVSIDVVTVPELSLWSDEEVDYACRVARAVGTPVICTPLSIAGPRRLAPVARRHGVVLSFAGGPMAGVSELGRLVDTDDEVVVSVDISSWRPDGTSSLLTFLDQHAHRVSHLRLSDTRDGAAVTFGSGEAPIREVLQAMRDHGWRFPALVVTEPSRDDGTWETEVADALAYCRTVLTGTT